MHFFHKFHGGMLNSVDQGSLVWACTGYMCYSFEKFGIKNFKLGIYITHYLHDLPRVLTALMSI